MTTLTLEYGLILQAPNYQLELVILFDQWINHAPFPDSIENTMKLNALIIKEFEEDYE